MDLVFLYGPPASGKLTIGRALAELTELPLFHNHLVVDTVASVFPFGSPEFVRLREHFWLEMLRAAVSAGRSLIFTFAPEPTVATDFPARVQAIVQAAGGSTLFVALTLSDAEQEKRVDAASRAEFGKLRSVELLRTLQADFAASMAAMPPPDLLLDTGAIAPDEAARAIADALSHKPMPQ
jgi:chloramphenicol 3-O-phosphotransferase